MGRRPKTLQELELSGSLRHNKGRYRHVLEPQTAPAVQTMQVQWRAPKEFNTQQKAAFREIVSSLPALVPEDRLLIEVCAQLLAKQKIGAAKASESNRLLATLEKLRTRAERAARIAPALPASIPPLEIESEEERYLREEAEDAADDRLDRADIEAELARRSNSPMPEGLSETERKHYFNPHEIALAIGVKVNLYDSEGYFSGTSSRRYQDRLKERNKQV